MNTQADQTTVSTIEQEMNRMNLQSPDSPVQEKNRLPVILTTNSAHSAILKRRQGIPAPSTRKTADSVKTIPKDKTLLNANSIDRNERKTIAFLKK